MVVKGPFLKVVSFLTEQTLHNVKSTSKILSNYVAFLENINFKIKRESCNLEYIADPKIAYYDNM